MRRGEGLPAVELGQELFRGLADGLEKAPVKERRVHAEHEHAEEDLEREGAEHGRRAREERHRRAHAPPVAPAQHGAQASEDGAYEGAGEDPEEDGVEDERARGDDHRPARAVREADVGDRQRDEQEDDRGEDGHVQPQHGQDDRDGGAHAGGDYGVRVARTE